VRETWFALDGQKETVIKVGSAALAHAVEDDHRPGGDIELTHLDVETVAILSAGWATRPLEMNGIEFSGGDLSEPTRASFEQILAAGARVGESLQIDPDGRFVTYELRVPGSTGAPRVFAAAEAVLLRQSPADVQRLAGQLKRIQGPHDGRVYKLLAELERHATRTCVRRVFARRAVSALWRDVRDEPAYLVRWPRSRGLAMRGARPSLRELRAILSEPSELEPPGDPPAAILFRRFDQGIWRNREDRWELLRLAVEVPGPLAFGPLRTLLGHQYEVHVDEALSILRRVEDHPIARVARSILLLRAGAAAEPLVKLPSGERVDLREQLPSLLRQVLEHVVAEPRPDTLGAAEPELLRICGKVVRDLAGAEPLSIREGLWLTYRLFQWLCAQLDALPFGAKLAGIRSLRALAPPPGPVQDRLDPYGFGRELFDHRLAAVLHALGAMDEVLRVLEVESGDRRAFVALRLAWEPAMIDRLVELASRPDESLGLSSELDWSAPDSIADLSLVALLRMDPNAFGRVPPAARLRRFRRLPQDPNAMTHADQSLFLTLVTGAATHPEDLSDEERDVLITKLRATPRGPVADRWRLLVLSSLFGLGDQRVSEEDARTALQEALDDTLAPMALTYLLFGVARSDAGRMGDMLDQVIAEAERRQIDPVPFAAGVGRVFLLVDEPARKSVIDLVRGLAARRPFQGDERMRELMVAFGGE
jgi:hypothetical protein